MNCVLCHSHRIDVLSDRYHGRCLGECPNCGLVQVTPMPSVKEIAALYHKDMEHFRPYIEQTPVHREYFKKELQEIKTRITYHVSRITILDIGCATGVLLEEAKRAGYKVQGIDISKDAVAYCRKNNLDVMEGILTSVWKKLKKNSYNVITAFEIIEHERDPLGMMTRIHELLKNGGIAVLTTPNHRGIWRKIMGKWWVGYRHPEHVTFWDPNSLTYLMKKAKFTNIHVRRDSPRPFPLSFTFTRSADYFPWLGWLLRPLGKLVDHLHVTNPINPWGDVLVYATK